MIRVAAEVFAKDTAAYLDKVEKGEEVWIEKDGEVIARVTRSQTTQRNSGAGAEPTRYEDPRFPTPEEDPVGTLLRLRERMSLGGLSWTELRDEGRR